MEAFAILANNFASQEKLVTKANLLYSRHHSARLWISGVHEVIDVVLRLLEGWQVGVSL